MRVEEGGLLAADVGAGAPDQRDVEAHAAARGCPRRARSPRGRRSGPSVHACGGQRVLRAQVEEAARGAGRKRLDDHPLDDGEGILLDQDPVLERAGLGFVGVADGVVRARRLAGNGRPLAARREGGAAAAEKARRQDLRDDRPPARSRAPAGARARRRDLRSPPGWRGP